MGLPINATEKGNKYNNIDSVKVILDQSDYILFLVSSYVNGFKEFDTTVVSFEESVLVGIYLSNKNQSEENALILKERFEAQVPLLIQRKLKKEIDVIVRIHYEY